MLLAEMEERQKFEKGQRETAEERWEAMRNQMVEEAQGLKEAQQVFGPGRWSCCTILVTLDSQSSC